MPSCARQGMSAMAAMRRVCRKIRCVFVMGELRCGFAVQGIAKVAVIGHFAVG